MKRQRIKGKYAQDIVLTLERAGYEFSGRNRVGHFVFACPGRPNAVVPSELDSKKTANKIAGAVGVRLG